MAKAMIERLYPTLTITQKNNDRHRSLINGVLSSKPDKAGGSELEEMLQRIHKDVTKKTNEFYEKVHKTDSEDEFDPERIQEAAEKKKNFIRDIESKKEFKKGILEMKQQI
jgi:hypothetical protein